MGKPYSPVNMKTFDLQFDAAVVKLKKSMVDILKKTAEGTFIDIVMGPPRPYLTGSYISSHRIGINEPDISDTVIHKAGIRTVEQAQSRALSELRKLDSVKEGDSIWISNSVGYSTKYGYSWARNVEYAGWPNNDRAYLVYETAIAKIPQKIKDYVTEVVTSME